ncbi:MAG: hypothetical protein AAB863_03345, partial [Patescibacteria group bacterium]
MLGIKIKPMFTINRSEHNPLLSPDKSHPWEAAAAFNGCPVIHNKKTYLVYRAMSEPERLREPHIRVSTIARAVSNDGGDHFGDRRLLVSPSEDFDRYGCEDPRITKLDKKYYIFYTGLGGYPFGADNIRVCVALSWDLDTVDEKHLVTPFNAKAMVLFPEKIGGKITALLTANSDLPPSEICIAQFEKPEDLWSPEHWNKWKENLDAHKLHIRRNGNDQLEIGAPPIKTKKGWLVVYSHIQRYGAPDVVFGIEAVLLDLKNPRKIIGRTKGPLMVNEEYYENAGHASHIVFPSGVIVKKIKGTEFIEIYYGAADTHCAKARVNLADLLKTITEGEKPIVKRFPGNPIITPRPKVDWEEKGTFNPAAIELNHKIHILYRAVSNKNVSVLGYAASKDGLSIDERSGRPVYMPRMAFEKNGESDSNFGCEDPRLVQIGDKIYMTYTAYNGHTPRVAATSISASDFENKKWSGKGGGWTEPSVLTPEGVDNKDACLLPEAINGKYLILHRVHEHICAYPLSSLDFGKEQVNQCIDILGPRRGMWDGSKVGIAAPPLKTKSGWLLLYHGVSWSTVYRVGAVLLDLKDPTTVLARTAVPLFEPEAEYEMKGAMPRVVFPCGLVARGDTAYMYYGAADSTVGVATFSLKEIL